MSSFSTTRRSLLGLIAGTVLVVGALGAVAGWALPVVVATILLMVMLHEFGHFIVAKRAGMLVTDFFVGFGPVLWSTTWGETRYGIRLLPLGGYVKVPGMTWTDDIDPVIESRTYRSASYPRKVLFASAGSLMHMVIAFTLAGALLMVVGTPQPNAVGVAGFEVWSGHVHNVAQEAGLHTGDRILRVDGVTVSSMQTVIDQVRSHAGRPVTLVVERGGQTLSFAATPADGRHIIVDGTPLATGATPQGYLGIALSELNVRQSLGSATVHAAVMMGDVIRQTFASLGHVFSPSEVHSLAHQILDPSAARSPAAQATRPESIVGVIRIADQAATTNIGALLVVLMSLNIFVGIMNMMPLLPLDGGYVAIASYERLRRRQGASHQADIRKLLPVVYVFVTMLALLFASTLYLDIVDPITNPFK